LDAPFSTRPSRRALLDAPFSTRPSRRALLDAPFSTRPSRRALLAVTLLSQFPITRYGHESLLPRIWTLRANLTAYDATYVALAEGLGCKLLTRDQHLATAPVARNVAELL
ncbi:MAG TPA: type II toxin-antitoxin system VapC family toxin, partial [Gemmatimonadaceae bacterium]